MKEIEVNVRCPKCGQSFNIEIDVDLEGSYQGDKRYLAPIGGICPNCGVLWDKIEVMEYKDGEIETTILLEKDEE